MCVPEGCHRIHPTTPNSWMQIRPGDGDGYDGGEGNCDSDGDGFKEIPKSLICIQ